MRDKSPGAHDPFAPPEIPTQVVCARCRCEYETYLMQWMPDDHYRSGGYWACPTPGCEGRGFTFDVWPADPEWTDDEGNRVRFFDDEVLPEDVADDDGDDDADADEVDADEVDDERVADDESVGDDEVIDDPSYPLDAAADDDTIG